MHLKIFDLNLLLHFWSTATISEDESFGISGNDLQFLKDFFFQVPMSSGFSASLTSYCEKNILLPLVRVSMNTINRMKVLESAFCKFFSG